MAAEELWCPHLRHAKRKALSNLRIALWLRALQRAGTVLGPVPWQDILPAFLQALPLASAAAASPLRPPPALQWGSCREASS